MDWRIPQISPMFDGDEVDGVVRSVQEAWLTEGPQAREFLQSLVTATGSRHAVLAPNGTLGLFLALLALDLPRDSEILIPSFTFYASATAAVFAGLRPVFADVDPDTFNIDVDGLDRLVTDQTTAIMPVHIYGHCAPMDEIVEFAARHRLAVIEDAAQAYGVTYRGRHAGTWGDVGVISFFADKTLTTGEGGVVLTSDDALHHRLRLLRNQGRTNSGTFEHEALGMNFRVTDLQCAVGNAQLRKLPSIIAAKQANHARYASNLAGDQRLQWMKVQPGSDHVPFRFALCSENRDRTASALEERGVQTRGFFYPLHRQPALRQYADERLLPVSDELHRTGLCLPVHQDLTFDDIDEICDVILTANREA